MNQARQARKSSEPKPSLLESRAASGLTNSNSVFDIFTIDAGGWARLVFSASSSFKAQETAYRLSRLMPGEYFGYFERMNEGDNVSERSEAQKQAS